MPLLLGSPETPHYPCVGGEAFVLRLNSSALPQAASWERAGPWEPQAGALITVSHASPTHQNPFEPLEEP